MAAPSSAFAASVFQKHVDNTAPKSVQIAILQKKLIELQALLIMLQNQKTTAAAPVSDTPKEEVKKEKEVAPTGPGYYGTDGCFYSRPIGSKGVGIKTWCPPKI